MDRIKELEKEINANNKRYEEYFYSLEHLGENVFEKATKEEQNINVGEFCEAYRTVKNVNGIDVAKLLYDNCNLILKWEIINAGKYIVNGGDIIKVDTLAENGYFEI